MHPQFHAAQIVDTNDVHASLVLPPVVDGKSRLSIPGLEKATAAALGPTGLLARKQPNFAVRAGQIEMAVAVAEAIESRTALVVEAGTGIGKTFAYLVPALLSGERILVSTATKVLQDQLFDRDLPQVLSALGLPARAAVLKGRSSYLCAQRLQVARQSNIHVNTQQHGLADIERWALTTRSGDLAELPQLDERSELAALVSSTRENCLGAACGQLNNCHVNQARRNAMAADIVVVNHHLLFADMTVREAALSEMLPRAGVVVVDEAHKLNDIGIQFLGDQWGSVLLRAFARTLRDVVRPAALGVADWFGLAASVEACTHQLLHCARSAGVPGRYGWTSRVRESGNRVAETDVLAPGAAPDPWDAPESPSTMGSPVGVETGDWQLALADTADCLNQCLQALELASAGASLLIDFGNQCNHLLRQVDFFAAPADENSVRWMDLGAEQFLVVDSPPNIGHSLRSRLMPLNTRDARGAAFTSDVGCDANRLRTAPSENQTSSWIFTSATLGDEKSMNWFTEACGLQDVRTVRVASPFDYAAQAALYVPTYAPAPGDSTHSAWVAAFAAQATKQLGGRTLVLTTTLRALQVIGDAMRQTLADVPGVAVLMQGQMSKKLLMERFRAGNSEGAPGCVLVASANFWEGFDVPGDKLQLVVIDKIPFPPPGDPLVAARMQQIESKGKNAFAHHAVPEAAVSLRQGAGRLIRSETDRGILVVCDRRLTDKGYGKRLLKALPQMRLFREEAEFNAALATLSA